MVAAPYKGTINLTAGPGGRVIQQEAIYGPDVANDYIQWYSNGQLDFVIAKQDCYISDIVLTAAGTDTARMQLFINGTDVNTQFIKAGQVSTVNNRIAQPIGPIRAGSMIQLKELA